MSIIEDVVVFGAGPAGYTAPAALPRSTPHTTSPSRPRVSQSN